MKFLGYRGQVVNAIVPATVAIVILVIIIIGFGTLSGQGSTFFKFLPDFGSSDVVVKDDGLMRYDLSNNRVQYYDGTDWIPGVNGKDWEKVTLKDNTFLQTDVRGDFENLYFKRADIPFSINKIGVVAEIKEFKKGPDSYKGINGGARAYTSFDSTSTGFPSYILNYDNNLYGRSSKNTDVKIGHIEIYEKGVDIIIDGDISRVSSTFRSHALEINRRTFAFKGEFPDSIFIKKDYILFKDTDCRMPTNCIFYRLQYLNDPVNIYIKIIYNTASGGKYTLISGDIYAPSKLGTEHNLVSKPSEAEIKVKEEVIAWRDGIYPKMVSFKYYTDREAKNSAFVDVCVEKIGHHLVVDFSKKSCS